MPRKKKYKVNASQIEVVDKANLLASKNVEDALKEIYNLASQRNSYILFVNEIPNPDSDFFENPELQIFRSSENIEITYDGTNERIEYNSRENVSQPQFATFTIERNILFPFISVNLGFPDENGRFEILFNKKGNNYYLLEGGYNDHLYLYKTINGQSDLIAYNEYITFLNDTQTTFYEVELKKRGSDIIVFINNRKYIDVDDISLNTEGKTEIILKSSLNNIKIYLKHLKIGSFLEEYNL